jgi:hypothetical protein
MGASISFDSKYRLILDTEVECISVNPPKTASAAAHTKKSAKGGGKGSGKGSGSDTGSSSGSGSDTGSDTGSGSGSDSDSGNDHQDKVYTVKITPEIAGYIRNYLRKNEFLDEFDLITEIDLDKYEHAPGSALVFNSDSMVFNTNNQVIETIGEWEYLPPENEAPSKSSKSSSSKKRRGYSDSDSDGDGDDNRNAKRSSNHQFKTKDDELPVSEIESILTAKFAEYNKCHEFVIHESKNSMLCLKINSVEIVKA